MGFNLLLGFTGVHELRPCRVFRPRRLRRGPDPEVRRGLARRSAMLAGTLLGGIAGTLFGLLLVRRRGVYFAMVTIAFGQVCFYIAYKLGRPHRRL